MASKPDTPKVHATLAKIRKETTAQTKEPFQLALPGSKIITFPDLFAQDAERAEQIVWGMQSGRIKPTQAARLWLDKEDADALLAEKLTLRELSAVMATAVEHYEDTFGNSGEGDASRG